VQIGEGVMSLRRAFRIAGAQTVLASHWKVSDKATFPTPIWKPCYGVVSRQQVNRNCACDGRVREALVHKLA
jgi:CHAT domain